MPKISIIVPIYNAENTLRRALDHLRSQTFSDFEAILVNDGSKDSSADICEEYCRLDSRFSLLNRENRGVSAARNAGIPGAHGEYITFADADDMALENWLMDVVPYMDGVGMIVTGTRTVGFNRWHPDYNPEERRTGVTAAIEELIRHEMIGYTWHKFYRTGIIREHGLRFDQHYMPMEDEEFLMHYMQRISDVQFVSSMQYVYDVPDFKSKYRPVAMDCFCDIARLVEKACNGDRKVKFMYLDRIFRKTIRKLRAGEVDEDGLRCYCKTLGMEGIWQTKSSFGTRMVLSLPSSLAVRIFRLEGRHIRKAE